MHTYILQWSAEKDVHNFCFHVSYNSCYALSDLVKIVVQHVAVYGYVFPNVPSIFSVACGFPRRYRHLRRSELRNETSPNQDIPLFSISSSIFPFSVVVSFPLELMCPLWCSNFKHLDFLSLDLLRKCAHKCNRKSNDSSFSQYSNIDAIRMSIFRNIITNFSRKDVAKILMVQ